MTTQERTEEEAWGAALLELPEEERLAQMQARYDELAVLDEEERCSRLTAMAQAEYALPDDKLKVFTRARLLAWLRMEPEAAKRVASSYDTIMYKMPGPTAMRRVSTVQTLSRELPPEEQRHLRALVPSVFGDQPTAVGRAWKEASTQPASSTAKAPWWAFWKRG